MTYKYNRDDMIYDIESLENVFTNAQWFPNPETNTLIISYLDDDEIIKSDTDKELIRNRILEVNPKLKEQNTKIVFENVGRLPELQNFVRRFGFATYETFNNFLSPDGSVNVRTEGPKAETYSKTPWQNPVQDSFNNYQENDYFQGLEDTNQKSINLYNGIAMGKIKPINKMLAPLLHSQYYPIKMTDPVYDKNKQGLRLGFNSTNYDLTLMAKAFNILPRELFSYAPATVEKDPQIIEKTFPGTFESFEDNWSAAAIRLINNQLFSHELKGKMRDALRTEETTVKDSYGHPKYSIRQNGKAFYTHKGWLQTNRFIDIAELNAHMTKVSLKRLSAFKSLQVKESEKLSGDDRIYDINEFAELLAYNISDVINTEVLFQDPAYQDSFSLHQELLNRFPELVYDRKFKKNDPELKKDMSQANEYIQRCDNLRYSRLTADSTSAKFVQYVIAPYEALDDDRRLTYMYPDKEILEELKQDPKAQEEFNIPDEPYDVLEATKDWIHEQDAKHFGDKTPIWDQFKDVYAMYDEIRDSNVNDTLKDEEGFCNISDVMKAHKTTLFYIGPNGKPTSSMVNFSVGGIHGAEINRDKYNYDLAEWQKLKDTQDLLKEHYHDDPVAAHIDREIEIDGVTYEPRKSLKSGSTNKHAEWKDLEKSKPTIFKKDGKVRDKYAFVSIDQANHEDFSSFYPLLLSRLAVFRDITGNDRYYKLYKERLALKAKLKTLEKNSPEWDEANLNQLVRKLLLNSASGQGDAKFYSNIRKNNATVAMRIIGQLFAWRIGQAEALNGARVPSTNTDGLYTMAISPEENNKVLFDTVAPMMIDIDPEIVDRFVSKDSNNRLEVEGDKLGEAKGSDLTAWRGPGVTNNLAHPAIVDNVLANYLSFEPDPSNRDFDRDAARKYLEDDIEHLTSDDPEVAANAVSMFQWIIVSGLSTHRYPYLEEQTWNPEKEEYEIGPTKQHVKQHAIKIPHTNRFFLVKSQSDVRHIVRLATRHKRTGKVKPNEEAQAILNMYGYDIEMDPAYDPLIQKITDMPDDQNVVIMNADISHLDKQTRENMAKSLDFESYLNMVENKFNKNWKNTVIE